MKTALTLIAAAAFFAFAGPASAGSASEVRSVRVSYADLDLSQPEGRATLERRIQRAVSSVCPVRPLLHDLRKFQEYRTCLRKTAADALQRVTEARSAHRVADATVQISPPVSVATPR